MFYDQHDASLTVQKACTLPCVVLRVTIHLPVSLPEIERPSEILRCAETPKCTHLAQCVPLLRKRVMLAELRRRLELARHGLEEILDLELVVHERCERLP